LVVDDVTENQVAENSTATAGKRRLLAAIRREGTQVLCRPDVADGSC